MPYVPHTDHDRRRMLAAIGVESTADLFRALPESLRLGRPLDLPRGMSEPEILAEFDRLGAKNRRMDTEPSFLGAGIYRRFVPAVVDAIAARGEFSTAYTPYQAEVSQGTLQAIMEYQTMICELTAMEVSNASLYDGATALAEAVVMAWGVRQRGSRVVVSEGVHPEYVEVLRTYLASHPIEIVPCPLDASGRTSRDALEEILARHRDDALAVVVQNPTFLGFVESGRDLQGILDRTGEQRPLLIAAVDPISLAVLLPPGEYGADIAVGDGQQLGNPPNWGGPTFGFFTSRLEHVRKMPGRIVGETKDREGRRGYVLTFQTREQHIRRERATSNICTNQGLCCLRAAVYLASVGKRGLREVAEASARHARHAFERLREIPGVEAISDAPFFQEFPLRLPLPAGEAYRCLAARGIGGGLPLGRYFPERSDEMLFAFTELTGRAEIDALADALAAVCRSAATPAAPAGPKEDRVR